MIELSLPFYTAITARQSGGGLGANRLPDWLTWLPELAFAVAFALPWLTILSGWWLLCLPAIVAWSFLWMQTATAPALHWGKGGYNPNRTSTLKPFVDRLAGWLRLAPDGVGYCRLYMAVKGFLIGLPVGGLPLAVLWPLGYELGNRWRSPSWLGHNGLTELLSGFGAGLAILLFTFLI